MAKWKQNPKRDKFAEFYSDHSDMKPEGTYGNITQSAVKAGYSKKYATSLAHRLLEDKRVINIISANEKEWQKRHKITKDKTISIAWHNYLIALGRDDHKEARLWYREYGELSGHYIQKTETKVQVEHTEDQLKEIESIRASIQPSRISDN